MPSAYTSGESVFVEVPVAAVFEEYVIESKSNNQIAFLPHIVNLLRALKSAENATSIKMKLANKGRPFLTFEIQSEGLSIVQDVPVTMKTMQDIQDVQEPVIDADEVKVKMPPLKSLRPVVERMKSVSDRLTFLANTNGDVCFQVEADMVTIRTYYKGLELKERNDNAEPITASVTMGIKKFLNILHCISLNSQFAIACLVNNCIFCLYVKLAHGKGTVTYYVPVLLD